MVDKEERKSVRLKWAQEDVAEAWEKMQDVYRDAVTPCDSVNEKVKKMESVFQSLKNAIVAMQSCWRERYE